MSRPHAPSVVPRQALFEALSAAGSGGVTLLSAPAGSGKTVLLRSWIDQASLGGRVAWVSVDRGERDAQRFWIAVVNALHAAVGTDVFVEKLTPAPAFDGNAVIDRLNGDLGSLDEPALLVIDDLHELRAPEALAQLERLLARRPPLLGVVLATRHDPQLGLHRLRLAGQLTEVRAFDLRFTPEDTRALLASSGIVLSDDGAARLLARTEGWAAGLRLATLSLAGYPDPERFVAEFSGSERTVAEYLLAEVLERQPDDVRRLLLRTSILERVNGALADVLTGSTGSERILQDLENANAFVVSLDAGRSWFRYHHLFADLLHLDLRRTEPAAVGELHRAAAVWHASHGNVVEAVRHAQAGQDWELAAQLLVDHFVSLWLDGQEATIGALLDGFPPEAAANPELAPVFVADQLGRGSLEEAVAYLAYAERHAAMVPDDRRPRFEVALAVARSWLARRRGDFGSVFDEVRPLLENTEPSPPGDVGLGSDLRALALMQLGIVEMWSGQSEQADRHLEQSRALAHRIGRPYIEVGCLAHVGLGKTTSLGLGRQRSLEAIALAEAHGWGTSQIVGAALARMGGYEVLQGRYAEAERWLDRAKLAVRPELVPATGILVHLAQGLQYIGRGRYDLSVTAFRQAEQLQRMLVDRHPLTAVVRRYLIHALLQLGDIAGARATLDLLLEDHHEWGEVLVSLASLRLVEESFGAAAKALAPVLDGSVPVLVDFTRIEALLLDALARDRLGEQPAAEAAIERALDLAEPEGLVFPFVVTPTRPLLERQARHRTTHAALISDILDLLNGASLPARAGEPPLPYEDLSESEIRVLRYLPTNLSAPEIAGQLLLSTATVKTHMRHIYAKLDVHGRTEAVERARARQLLGPTSRHH